MPAPLISVIVPVYNVEKYLDRCVQSIVDQTYKNLEIILVDDGSPDNCGTMCDAWAAKDSRIKVIHKKNGGLSDARNAGLAVATGEYIGFIDSDDWIAPQFYEELYNAIVQYGCDLAECKYRATHGDNPAPPQTYPATTYSRTDAMQAHLSKKAFHQVVWNKLYRKAIISVPFEVGRYHEDEFWTYQIIGNCNSLVHISAHLYYYFQRESSIMGQNYSLKRLDAVVAKSRRFAFVQKHFPSLAQDCSVDLAFTCLYHGQMALRHLCSEDQKKAFSALAIIYKNMDIPKQTFSSQSLTHRLWLRMAKISLPLTCRIRTILNIGF